MTYTKLVELLRNTGAKIFEVEHPVFVLPKPDLFSLIMYNETRQKNSNFFDTFESHELTKTMVVKCEYFDDYDTVKEKLSGKIIFMISAPDSFEKLTLRYCTYDLDE